MRGFEVLTGSYLGEDWDLYGKSIDEALAVFVREGRSDDITSSIEGFETLLATPMTEQEYYDRWIYGLHSGYDPRDDGFTYREWFAHALALLKAEAAKTPG